MSAPTFLRAFRWNYEKAMLQVRDDVKAFHSPQYLAVWQTGVDWALVPRGDGPTCTQWCATSTEALKLASDCIKQEIAARMRDRDNLLQYLIAPLLPEQRSTEGETPEEKSDRLVGIIQVKCERMS